MRPARLAGAGIPRAANAQGVDRRKISVCNCADRLRLCGRLVRRFAVRISGGRPLLGAGHWELTEADRYTRRGKIDYDCKNIASLCRLCDGLGDRSRPKLSAIPDCRPSSSRRSQRQVLDAQVTSQGFSASLFPLDKFGRFDRFRFGVRRWPGTRRRLLECPFVSAIRQAPAPLDLAAAGEMHGDLDEAAMCAGAQRAGVAVREFSVRETLFAAGFPVVVKLDAERS